MTLSEKLIVIAKAKSSKDTVKLWCEKGVWYVVAGDGLWTLNKFVPKRWRAIDGKTPEEAVDNLWNVLG